jgi:hypothetical protein
MQTSLETQAAVPADKRADRAFGFSLAFSAVRCILQYAILPFVLPIIGVAGDFAIQITMAINLVAIVSILYSLQRVWRINYRQKWAYTVIGGGALIILLAFIALDLGLIQA